MMCLKDLLLYTLLLPVPAASPIFILLYIVALLVTIRPCGYCIALFSALFLTSSPSSPFIDKPHPQLPIDPLYPLTSPVTDRDWLSFNDGRLADPGLVGYREIAALNHTDVSGSPDSDNSRLLSERRIASTAHVQVADPQPEKHEARLSLAEQGVGMLWGLKDKWTRSGAARNPSPGAAHTDAEHDNHLEGHGATDGPSETDHDTQSTATPVQTAASTQRGKLPRGYFDFSLGGTGFILDFGFSRTEEGVAWEKAEVERAMRVRPARRVLSRVSGDAPREETKVEDEPVVPDPTVEATPPPVARSDHGLFGRIPFLGSW